ncbi:MAG: hypothetical protein RJA31_1092 [Actinomycetota bacterium]
MENDTTPEPTTPVRRRVRKPVVDATTADSAPAAPTTETAEPDADVTPKQSWLAGTIPTKAAAGVAVIAGVAGGIAGAGIGFVGNGGFGFNTVIQPQSVTISDTNNTKSVTAVAAKALQSVVTIEVAGGEAGGSGSGVIISDDGYIVTNHHVVTAKVIGTDPIMDVAVIKIAETGLVPAEWGDSSAVTVGDESIAIGAPLGLENTVTDDHDFGEWRRVQL